LYLFRLSKDIYLGEKEGKHPGERINGNSLSNTTTSLSNSPSGICYPAFRIGQRGSVQIVRVVCANQTRIGTIIKRLHSTAITVQEMFRSQGISRIQPSLRKLRMKCTVGLCDVSRWDLTEPNANDLALFIIIPITYEFIEQTGRNTIQLFREKQVMSEDGETGGYEEFVVIDGIEVENNRYIFIIEAIRKSLGNNIANLKLQLIPYLSRISEFALPRPRNSSHAKLSELPMNHIMFAQLYRRRSEAGDIGYTQRRSTIRISQEVD